MRRREFLGGGKCLLLPTLIALGPGAGSAQGQGWELRFLRVWQFLQVRVGGANGPLIQLCGRPGYTWTYMDPVPSTIFRIGQWVSDNAPVVRLYARIAANQGSPSCVMQTLFGGVEKQRWSFSSEAYYEIRR
jgi:hypothetical protein